MCFALNKIIPPKEWQHDPNMIDNFNNCTVGMYLAGNGIIPPKYWEHKPEL